MSTADLNALVGIWKLVSWHVVAKNEEPQNLLGTNPKGYLILTREGRSMVLATSDQRTGGMGDTERAALHKSMLAYTGTYRIEGDDFITTVDVSWNEDWNGTEQRRHFRIEGDRLLIESVLAPSIVSPGTIDFRRIVWVRETGSNPALGIDSGTGTRAAEEHERGVEDDEQGEGDQGRPGDVPRPRTHDV